MLASLSKYQWYIFSISFGVISIFILFNFNGTGIEADSINHFLHAKYAPQHVALYFNHWAKPLFTLLSSPFAQFGLIGIKVFNILCAFGASFFIFKATQKLGLKSPILAPIFYFIFPISFTTTFSGLTEPLCALFISATVYLFLHKRYLISALLISFTPFIRSEGLIFIGVLGVFFLSQKNWKAILFLSVGHVVYTICGFIQGQELLWVFTKIPYAHLSSHYGSGGLFHFAEKLNYLMGIPLLILFILGWIYWGSNRKIHTQTNFLIFSLFLAFFIAHSLFWYLEIFNSMGLKRVFAAVTPLMAIITLFGFNWLEKTPNIKLKGISKIVVITLILVFPFTKNPAAIDWNDLNLTEAQENATDVAQYIKDSNLDVNRFIYTAPYLSKTLNIDPFNSEMHQILAPAMLQQLKKNDLIIWDNWHAVIDYGVNEELVNTLQLIKAFKKGNSIYKIYIYLP